MFKEDLSREQPSNLITIHKSKEAGKKTIIIWTQSQYQLIYNSFKVLCIFHSFSLGISVSFRRPRIGDSRYTACYRDKTYKTYGHMQESRWQVPYTDRALEFLALVLRSKIHMDIPVFCLGAPRDKSSKSGGHTKKGSCQWQASYTSCMDRVPESHPVLLEFMELVFEQSESNALTHPSYSYFRNRTHHRCR